jgi:hypothetical protein
VALEYLGCFHLRFGVNLANAADVVPLKERVASGDIFDWMDERQSVRQSQFDTQLGGDTHKKNMLF